MVFNFFYSSYILNIEIRPKYLDLRLKKLTGLVNVKQFLGMTFPCQVLK